MSKQQHIPSKPSSNNWRTRLAARLLKLSPAVRKLLTELQEAEQQQLLDQQALRMMQGVLQVARLQVREIMIPRAQMICLEQNSSIASVLSTIIDSSHSRFPVISPGDEHVVGILLAKDLLGCLNQSNSENDTINHLVRPASFIPESKRIDSLLDEFRNHRKHMAIVVDEFGSTAGLITIEDLLEEIVGEIEDEHDLDPRAYIKQINATSYQVQARTPLKQINQHFHTAFDPEQIDTLGGLINQHLGRIAKRGEQLTLGSLQLKILSVDARFIKKVLVKIKK